METERQKKYIKMIQDYPGIISDIEKMRAGLMIETENNLELLFAPHNLYIYRNAKILMTGICPGLKQSLKAISAVQEGKSLKEAKLEARFIGQTKQNLIQMLSELNLQEYIRQESIESALAALDSGLESTALIPFPVFVNGKNYSGHHPKIYQSNLLNQTVQENFVPLIQKMHELKIIIPLGKCVEEEIIRLEKEGKIPIIPLLKGFPHPSGLNAQRNKQFHARFEQMQKQLKEVFDEQ